MYQSKDLSVLSYANGFTWWHYTTPDDLIEVLADGYFDNAKSRDGLYMVKAGDQIQLSTSSEGRRQGSILHVYEAPEKLSTFGKVRVEPMMQTIGTMEKAA